MISRRIAVPAALAWFCAMAVAFGALARYKATPSDGGAIPQTWPAHTALLSRPADRPTLVLFAHPKCPCTRASLSELRAVVSERGDRVETIVVFYVPKGSRDWTSSDIHRNAESIAGVRVVDDLDGSITRAFGAITSGHVALYDTSGSLRYEGGITGSRGHAGDNEGRRNLIDAIDRRDAPRWPVFGCPMKDGTP